VKVKVIELNDVRLVPVVEFALAISLARSSGNSASDSEILDNVERWLKDAQQIPLQEHPLSTGKPSAPVRHAAGLIARLLDKWQKTW